MTRGNATRVLAVGLAAVALQSCTLISYDLNDKLETSRSAQTACDVRYSIKVESATYTNTFGTDKTDRKHLQKAVDRYVADTDAVLRRKGCRAAYTDGSDGATLEIHIVRFFYVSAQGQEVLTGLTFGLIPSWSTRPAQYTYHFTDRESGKEHRYTVDTKTYHHLILFPVFWVNFLLRDESDRYKEALTNFLEHSGSSASTSTEG